MVVPRALAGRYAFAKRIRGTQKTIIWFARDQVTSAPVVASVVPGPRAAGLEPLVGLEHDHAARVLGVFEPEPGQIPDDELVGEDARIAVAEYVEGRSLQQRLEAGPISVETAVEWTAALADALAAMHALGGVHGAISPRAVLAVRPSPAITPLITHLLTPTSGSYCSPERVTGGGPTEADDTWALSATLYTALARRGPFHGASRTELARSIVAAKPAPLSGVNRELAALVMRGLGRDPKSRFASAAELRDALRDWMDRTGAHSLGDFAPVSALVGASEPPPAVGDLSLVAALARPDSPEAVAPLNYREEQGEEPPLDELSSVARPGEPPAMTSPPPLAEVTPATPMTATAAVQQKKVWSPAAKMALVALAAASAAVGVLAGRLRGSETPTARPTGSEGPSARTAPAVRPAPPSPAAPTEVATPVAMTSASASGAATAPLGPADSAGAPQAAAIPGDPNACFRATLPDGTVGDRPDLAYLCTETEVWGLARRANLYVAKHGRGPGMSLWAHLGRFDLAAIGVLRNRCCPGAPPLRAATPKGVCETLSQSLADVAATPTPDRVERYAGDVECLLSRGVKYPSEWWDRVGPKDARGYFDQYLGSLGKR